MAPPVTMSPPAKTPGRFVACVDSGLPSSAAMLPHLVSSRPGVDFVTTGFALVPSATMTVSQSRSLNLPGRHGLAAPLLVGIAEDHLLDLHALHVAVGVRVDLDRRVEEEELDPLLLRVADLLDAGGRLRLGAAVDAADRRRAEALRDAQAVHRGVAGADDRDALAEGDRRVLEREDVPAHEVHAGEELVRRVDLARVLAGDADERRGARADAEEHRVEALLLDELRDGEGLADDLVGLDLHALVGELLHLAVDDLAREAEGRDAVLEHAADHVERLVDGDVRAELHEVGGGGEAGGAGAADGDLAELLREPAGARRASTWRCRRRSARGGRCRPTRPSSR